MASANTPHDLAGALQNSLLSNLNAAADMLGNAISMCPDETWNGRTKFYYIAYHTLVFFDYFISIPPEKFSAGLPYTLYDPFRLPENAIDDVVPDAVYPKRAMLAWLHVCKDRCNTVVSGLGESDFLAHWLNGSADLNLDLVSDASRNCSVLEILVYNLRHVQHHVAQLNMLLRQETGEAPGYIAHALKPSVPVREKLINNYLSGYNNFDVEAMIADLSESIVFENESQGTITLHLEGIDAFRQQATQALSYFSSRRQQPVSMVHSMEQTTVNINYSAILATDFPDGMKKGSSLALKGRTVFEFSGELISRITDIA
ncbi:nuclear transport factor 2 family protein [Flavihumibacter petaseus]|uniref:SnoaL-like domain-containing protein n=1 Tax=Flavihumibacter petaseus NBRC 106054 TaxID=1220578 RepID=A0A0E9N2I4_9BACT|nr:nuclear transport factor 2 family protein [Flavihumibacter petaseus]GAO44217.1 hypothetical protein FPE01S_03_02550 [Flavihumibacter petaseus NBRC 106054]